MTQDEEHIARGEEEMQRCLLEIQGLAAAAAGGVNHTWYRTVSAQWKNLNELLSQFGCLLTT